MRSVERLFKMCPECKTLYSGSARFCPKDGAPLELAQKGTVRLYDPYVGTVQDNRLKIEASMAEDGLTVLYAARHLVLDRRVAVKVLRSEYASDKVVVERFLEQARQSAKLDHPNLAKVLDSGRFDDGAPFFVIEFLGMRTLRGVMDQSGPLPWSRTVSLGIQACAGLEYAHRAGVVHGNLNPEALVLVKEGPRDDRLKVSGFGTSEVSLTSRHATKTGFLVGVPEYMSPEQAAGRPTGPWTDIYSLSVIFFEMMTGKVPFESDSFMGALGKHMVEPIPDPRVVSGGVDVPDWLASIIMKGLAKAPKDRYETMAEMASELATHGGAATVHPALGLEGNPDVDEKAPTRVYQTVADDVGVGAGATVMDEGAPVWEDDGPDMEKEHDRSFEQNDKASFLADASHAQGGSLSKERDNAMSRRPRIPWSERMVSLEQVIWAAAALALGLVLGLGIIWLNRDGPQSRKETRQSPSVQPESLRERSGKLPSARPPSGTPERRTIDLVVETQPAGAEVELDGKLLGVSPLRIQVHRAPGAHLLTARLSGFTPYRTEVTLAQATQLRIQLERPEPAQRRRRRPRYRSSAKQLRVPPHMGERLVAPSGSNKTSSEGKKSSKGDLLDPFKL